MNPITQTGPTSPPHDDAGPDLTGRTLADFNVLRRLGSGGMGQVYLAEQLSLKRKVALKILRADLAADPTSLQRFKAEAEAVAKVNHTNIVQVYAFGAIDGLPYMALEYVEGRNLREFVEKKGPPELLVALSIMRQTAAALQRASEAGIVHRDVKPENILLNRKAEVKVTDFGLSRCLGDPQPLHLTQSGVTMGTPQYMSPEQAEGKPLDSRTDIYSFGVTSYFMLAGQPPFDGATAFEVAMKHARDEPPPLASIRPDLPAALCALVHKMMAKDPANRHQTGKELLRDLARIRETLSGQTAAVVGASPSSSLVAAPSFCAALPAAGAPTQPGPRRRRTWTYAVVGLSLVVALGLGAGLGWLRRTADDAAPVVPNVPAGDAADADDDLLPVNDEEALRKLVDKYLQPSGAGRNVSVGMGLCLDLSILYLDQHRLNDADKLFERLAKAPQARQYQTLGRLGGGIVLALRDEARESNRRFKDVLATDPLLQEIAKRSKEGKPADPEIRKMWSNPQFRFWLARAVDYNVRNGVPDKDVPPAVLRWREPHPPKG